MYNIYQFNKKAKSCLSEDPIKKKSVLKRAHLVEQYENRIQKFVMDMVESPFILNEYKDFDVNNAIGHNMSSDCKGKRLYFNYSPDQFRKNKAKRINDFSTQITNKSSINSRVCEENQMEVTSSIRSSKLSSILTTKPRIIQPNHLRYKSYGDLKRINDSIIPTNGVNEQREHIDRKTEFNESNLSLLILNNKGNKHSIEKNVASFNNKKFRKLPQNKLILKKSLKTVQLPKTYYQGASYLYQDPHSKPDPEINLRSEKSDNHSTKSSSSILYLKQDKVIDSFGRYKSKGSQEFTFSDTRYEIIKNIIKSIDEKSTYTLKKRLQTYKKFVIRVKDKCKKSIPQGSSSFDPISCFGSIFKRNIFSHDEYYINGYEHNFKNSHHRFDLDPENMKYITKKVLHDCGYIKSKK